MRKYLRAFLCEVVFRKHKFIVVEEFGEFKKLQCKRCGRFYGRHDTEQQIIQWDGELEHLTTLFKKYDRKDGLCRKWDR